MRYRGHRKSIYQVGLPTIMTLPNKLINDRALHPIFSLLYLIGIDMSEPDTLYR